MINWNALKRCQCEKMLPSRLELRTEIRHNTAVIKLAGWNRGKMGIFSQPEMSPWQFGKIGHSRKDRNVQRRPMAMKIEKQLDQAYDYYHREKKLRA